MASKDQDHDQANGREPCEQRGCLGQGERAQPQFQWQSQSHSVLHRAWIAEETRNVMAVSLPMAKPRRGGRTRSWPSPDGDSGDPRRLSGGQSRAFVATAATTVTAAPKISRPMPGVGWATRPEPCTPPHGGPSRSGQEPAVSCA